MMRDNSKLLEAASSGSWTHVCDSCRTAARAVYCQADSAYLCIGCDTGIHAVNSDSWMHERVLVCEACECMPASFSCKADAASLCINCDAKIHSANALARRHHRIPILPITGFLHGHSPAHPTRRFVAEIHVDNGFLPHKVEMEEEEQQQEEDETSSWLLFNPVKNNNNQSNGFLFGNEVEEYLDLEEYNSCSENQYYGSSESVVPVQCGTVKDDHHHPNQQQEQQQQNLQLEMDFEASKAGFSYNSSISQSVSMSSMEASIVPDTNVNEVANSHTRPSKGTIDLFSSTPYQITPQFSSMDREARVLRYREKRKTRKFEKTIRYASRKAYAETRPRIKGRFAKRTDAEFEVDQIYASNVIPESGYRVVPSF